MIFVYIILCHVKRLCYTPTLVYTTLCHTICIYMPYPLWYMTMDYNLIHYINILYYYYYNNYNSYLFLFLLLCCCMCVCVCMCCAVLSLLCVCVCVLSCVSSHMLIHVYLCVCLPRLTLLGCAVVKRLMCWYIGGYISGKNFYKIWKMGIPRKNRPQEHFYFGKTVKTLDKTVQMCYNINIETKGDWYYDETRLLNHFSRRKTRFSG